MPFSIVPSHAVPVSGRIVSEAARQFAPSSNIQTRNPPFPILFFDQVVVPSGASNAFRSEQFTNNTGRPIELRSMRVLVQITASATQRIRGGGVVALDLEIAGVKVTRGSVPVWAMCRSDNRVDEGVVIGVTAQIAAYCWHFSQPVPLMPGQGVKITATHLGAVPLSATVAVSFAGRVSPAAIPTRIPFVAAWTSRAFAYAEAAVDSAPPDAIVNDTKRDLNVDRIIGRSVAFDDTGSAGTLELADFADTSVQGVTSFLLRLGLSQNRPILRTYTPWRTVFGQNAAIETDFTLKAGDYLTADVRHIAGPALPLAAFAFSQNRGVVSIVGWREV